MHCTNCGAQLPDGSVFCTNCGAQMAPEEPKTFCTNCGSTVSASASACPTCGQALTPPTPEKKPVDTKKLLTLAGIGVAAIAVVVLLIVLISSLFGGKMPQDGIDKLLDKGNFTIEVKMGGQKVELKVDMDIKKHELTAYGEMDGEVFAIYDGHVITGSEDYGYYAEDISDELDEFFEAYEKAEDADWEEVAGTLEDVAGIDVEDFVDIKKFEKAMKTFEKNMEKKSWLKENMGYETKNKSGVKLHIYEPDLYKFASASLEIFKDCLEDDDLYDTAKDFLKEYKSMLKEVDISAELGVKGGYLVSAEIDAMGQKVKVKITDIGKTKIDTKDLEDLLDEAE